MPRERPPGPGPSRGIPLSEPAGFDRTCPPDPFGRGAQPRSSTRGSALLLLGLLAGFLADLFAALLGDLLRSLLRWGLLGSLLRGLLARLLGGLFLAGGDLLRSSLL